MPTIVWRRLVIDASVARSCGGPDATYPTSVHCRNFLLAVQSERYHVVITPAITAEWNKHQSKFVSTWLTTMQRRGKVHYPKMNLAIIDPLRDKIESITVREEDNTALIERANRDAMLKDFLLIEAAMLTDKTVISLDERARTPFKITAYLVIELQEIVWVNPGKQEEQPILWLKDGAKPDKERLLGYVP